MSRISHSVAMTAEVEQMARSHLLRPDGQEDLCFALYRVSSGRSRKTALVYQLLLPDLGERVVHGNVSFNPQFLERALGDAAKQRAGLVLLHSHPDGIGWQGMSPDDVVAEQGNAGAVFGATELPLLGLTLAGDFSWSARFWERVAPRKYERLWCGTVRILGERITVHYFDKLAPKPQATRSQLRTVSAWGQRCQDDLVRLRIGVIGAGSVGAVVADGLGRIGFEDIVVMDFDHVEEHNLDRLLYATKADIGKAKIDVLAEHLRQRSTAEKVFVETISAAIFEESGFRAALDCDLLISCVDRPWGRYVMNLIAYAHLVPVVDGGIAVRTNKLGQLTAADWRSHIATVGRPCLRCLGQYEPSDVQLEREGFLDDPDYIQGLPRDHALKVKENVYAFALSCGSAQLLQMLAFAVAPLGRSNHGAQMYHFVGGFSEPPQMAGCKPDCAFPKLIASGDSNGIPCTGIRKTPTPPSVELQKTSPQSVRFSLASALSWLRNLAAAVGAVVRRKPHS